ncbi:MAG TPA: Gfo/Idh/MocA family oxidoreductase [Bryobacteraceae bacterium]|nr:Gfo/Idh/MocA family oxidoreductase [Bryobacteraceae bacterium]
MTNRLRGAVVGCGFFGKIHLEAWGRIPEAVIVAACDTGLEAARAAAPAAYDDLERMLDAEQPDFLDIATRPELHLPMLRIAAARRIPVICQKPMAPVWEDCLAMVRIAERAGIPFMIHENWRWQPWYRVVAAEMAKGYLGNPVTYTFRTRKRDGAGAEPYSLQPYFRQMPRLLLFETLVHHIDTARFLFGELDTLYARTRRVNPHIAGEDQVLLVAAHHSGLAGVMDGNRFLDLAPDSPPLGDAQFEFENGALRVAPNGDVLRLTAGGGALLWKNEVTSGYRGDSVRATLQHFVRSLQAGLTFETAGRDYLVTVAAVEAGYRSQAEGRAVRVPTPADIEAQL